MTGLLRRADGDFAVQRKFPIGILPLGRTNTVATSLFFDSDKIKMMVEATMAIIKEITKPIDVLKVEVLEVSIQLICFTLCYHVLFFLLYFPTLHITKVMFSSCYKTFPTRSQQLHHTLCPLTIIHRMMNLLFWYEFYFSLKKELFFHTHLINLM